jgi:hypothetical protein
MIRAVLTVPVNGNHDYLFKFKARFEKLFYNKAARRSQFMQKLRWSVSLAEHNLKIAKTVRNC